MRTLRGLLGLCTLLGIVAAVGCGGGGGRGLVAVEEDTPTAEAPSTAPSFTNASTYLHIPTYDGSGQVVHPDIAYFPDGWHGHKYWLGITPYPYDTDSWENPSIVVSDDGLSWAVPDGLTNPVVPRPACDHNSDPDIVYNPRTDELYLYYTEQSRVGRCPSGNTNSVRLVTSADGIHWSEPQTVMSWNLDTDPLYLSPAVVNVDGTFHIWLPSSLNTVVHATSDDGVHWSALETVDLPPLQWHLDVSYVKGRFWMVFVDSPLAGSRLRLATSDDGLKWTSYADPILAPGVDWDNERIYRATLIYDDATGMLRLWYSAKNTAGQWHVGYAETPR